MSVCTTTTYAAEVACEVKTQLDSFADKVFQPTGLVENAEAAITAIDTTLGDYIASLLAIIYDPDTGAIDLDFIKPTTASVGNRTIAEVGGLSTLPSLPDVPDSPSLASLSTLPTAPSEVDYSDDGPSAITQSITELPDGDDVAIGDTRWNQIFTRAEGLIGRDEIKRTWRASKQAAAMGHSQLSLTQNALLSEAQDEGSAQTSELAQTSAIEQSKAEREDIVTIANMNLDNYTRIWQAIKTYVEAGAEELNAKVAAYRAEIDARSHELSANQQTIDLYKAELDGHRVELDTRRVTQERERLSLDYHNSDLERFKAMVAQDGTRIDYYNHQLSAEDARLRYNNAQANLILEEANKSADFAIAKVQALLSESLNSVVKSADLYVGLTQAVLNAVDYGMTASGDHSVNVSE